MHSEPFTDTVRRLSLLSACTVSSVEPVMLPEDAVIVVAPAVLCKVASQLEPEVLLIVATAVFEELQVTDVVIIFVVLSE